MRKSDHILYENQAAKKFTEAYPIGNGHIGAMIYGDLPRMKIGVSHDEIWSGYEENITHLWDKSSYIAAQNAAMNGEYAQACQILEQDYAKLNAKVLLTLGDLYLDLEDADIGDYRRELDISRSVATVSFCRNGTPLTAEFFTSFPRNMLICNIKSGKPTSFSVTYRSDITVEECVEKNAIITEGVCPVDRLRNKDGVPLPLDYGDRTRAIAFCTALSARTDGTLTAGNGRLQITGAKNTTIYYTVETTYCDGYARGKPLDTILLAVKSRIADALTLNTDDLLSEHLADVSSLYNTVEVEFDSQDYSHIPTSERVMSQSSEDISLINLVFNYGRYLMIASSRTGTCATPLQGIWCNSMSPPWGGAYTTNINTEMNYWSTLPTGMLECTEPLEHLVRILNRTGKAAARDLFGARGACSCHNSDIFGHATPVAGMAMWSFFPCAYAWLVGELWRRYEYTADTQYVKSIYSLVEDAALFFIDTLIFDGKYYIFSPGTSPENRYIVNNEVMQVAKSSTMFSSIAREALGNYLTAASMLGIVSEDTARAEEIIEKLLPPRIMSDGRIDEWYLCDGDGEAQEQQRAHRHISHLYGLFPAREFDTDELRRAAAVSLDMRGDASTGWSLGWKLCCRARLFDGEACMRLLRLFLTPCTTEGFSCEGGGIYTNLFCAHPPFQIDGNFAFVAAICEMLVSEHGGEIYTIPAVPRELGSGRARGIRISGGRAVDLSFKNGTVTEFKVYKT